MVRTKKQNQDSVAVAFETRMGSKMICPMCGRRANGKFYDHKKRVWVYKHPPKKKYEASIYHEAEN